MAVVVSVVALAAFFRFTDLGIAVRASAESADRAVLLGIPVKRVQLMVWAIASVLAFVAVFLRAGALGLPLGEVNLAPSWPSHGWLLALAVSSQVVGWLLISISLPRLPAALMVAGVVLFSGSIFALVLGGPRLLGPVTPLGGLCLIAGWLSVLTLLRD